MRNGADDLRVVLFVLVDFAFDLVCSHKNKNISFTLCTGGTDYVKVL